METKIWYQVRGGFKKKSGFFRIFFKPFHRTMIIIVILYWKLFPVKSNWFYYEFLCKQTVVISIRLTKLWHNNDNDKSWSAGTITGFSRLIIHWMHKVWTPVLPDLCPPALEAESLSVVSFQYNLVKIRNSMIKMFVLLPEQEAAHSDIFSPQLVMYDVWVKLCLAK